MASGPLALLASSVLRMDKAAALFGGRNIKCSLAPGLEHPAPWRAEGFAEPGLETEGALGCTPFFRNLSLWGQSILAH